MRAPPLHRNGLDDVPRVVLVVGMAVLLVLTCAPLVGCGAASAAGSLAKVLAAWDDACSLGHGALVVAAQVTHEPHDAGASSDAGATDDASAAEGGAP